MHIHRFVIFWHILSADIHKSAAGVTFSTISLLRTLYCSEAVVTEIMHTV